MMKKNINILRMNRKMNCLSKSCIFAAILMMIPFTSIMAQKSTQNQTRILKGLIIDARSKQPLSAAQISIPNKNLSAVSNDKGVFILKNVSSKDVLHVTAYDYNKREIAVQGKDSVVIELYSDQFQKYFKTVIDMTGTKDNSAVVSSIRSNEDLSKSTVLSADEMLQSAFGGDVRSVTRSGNAGMGSSVFIRGINSINTNAQPLYVIDGVLWNSMYDTESIHAGFWFNPLSNIDINDIENVTVIKDGSSIYGSKASNGVIMINTKRATSMVTKISLNILTGVTETPGSLPMMKGEDFRLYASDLLGTKGIIGNDVSSYGFMNVDPASSTYNIYHNNTNWSDQIYQKGLTNSYLINASGGDEKALYYFSVGYTTNKGVVKTTDFQRINARFNADFKLVEDFDLAMRIGFSRIERNLLNDGMNQYTSPTWVSTIKSPFLSPYSFTSSGEKTTSFAYADEFDISSPMGLIYASINNFKNYRFNIGLTPSIKISPEFTLSTQFDFNLHKTIEGHFIPMHYTAPRLIVDKGFSYNQISSQVMRNNAIYDDTRLTYNRKSDGINSLKAMYGFRFINNYYESDYAEEHNSGSNNNTTINGSYNYLKVSGINNLTKSLSHYLNAEYDYDKRYFVNATMSLDASSRFGRKTLGGIRMFGESWGVFPSVNAAWLVTSEEFMNKVNVIDFLKLKIGYGITGNDGIRDYESMAYFNTVRFYGRANGLVISNLENPKIQWENTMRANAGFDLGLLNDRLAVTFDYFAGNTNNLLILKDLPAISGLGKYWTNGGALINNGFEMSVNMKVLNLKNLKWELGLSTGHYQNKITKLNVEGGQYTTQVYDGEVLMAEGQPVGVFYGYKTNGVFSTQQDATTAGLKIKNEDGTFTDFGAGDIYFDDKEQDGIIDEKDKQIIGNPNPDLYGNITSKWFFNRFTLSTVFTYSYGNDVYNYYRSQLESGSTFNNQTTAVLDRWTADGQFTSQPKAVYGDPMGNARFSDRWIEDGSYLRFKNITLSYELPIKSKYFEGLNLWISANNLFTVTNYLGLDPEFSTGNSVYYQGIDAGLLPQTKSYYFGIKLNL